VGRPGAARGNGRNVTRVHLGPHRRTLGPAAQSSPDTTWHPPPEAVGVDPSGAGRPTPPHPHAPARWTDDHPRRSEDAVGQHGGALVADPPGVRRRVFGTFPPSSYFGCGILCEGDVLAPIGGCSGRDWEGAGVVRRTEHLDRSVAGPGRRCLRSPVRPGDSGAGFPYPPRAGFVAPVRRRVDRARGIPGSLRSRTPSAATLPRRTTTPPVCSCAHCLSLRAS
jgi:hypothetical protein